MNVQRIEKVTNGWVAYDEFNVPVAVATSGDQLAEILGIDINPVTYQTDTVFLTMKPDFNFGEFWADVKAGRKIDAIKAFRRAFVSDIHHNVSVGLKDAKDFVESIMYHTTGRYGAGCP